MGWSPNPSNTGTQWTGDHPTSSELPPQPVMKGSGQGSTFSASGDLIAIDLARK
jgi:hypothetical protein